MVTDGFDEFGPGDDDEDIPSQAEVAHMLGSRHGDLGSEGRMVTPRV
jgi:hypothetical protein